jgi:hypothetical protein
MMKKLTGYTIFVLFLIAFTTASFAAYHHEGEKDAAKFLSVYPEKAGSKLDHCALCHTGGEYPHPTKPGQTIALGSCQWCHDETVYGYDGSGDIKKTLNDYGKDYYDFGRNEEAVLAIETRDSDGDNYSNLEEIEASRFPGDADDDPSKIPAPSRIYTLEQLEALGGHTQFLLMNTSRSGDYYAEYTGIPMEDLLKDAGVLDSVTGITVYAPDGWSQYHPMQEDPDQSEFYHVKGAYPEAVYFYDEEANEALTEYGWCDYSAPSCVGRNNGDGIFVEGGLKMILAYQREGLYMDPGILNEDNKLDGEGPFRVVPPQKTPSPPDQSSTADNQDVIWPYVKDWDHNAGAATRSVTIIRVDPLPEGTTDIDVMEAGWAYVDNAKIIIYGAIDDADSNGNGVLDSEEGTDIGSDFDSDGIPDFQDKDTAHVRRANGAEKILLHTSKGKMSGVQCLSHDDPAVPQNNKPGSTFPYGATRFTIEDLAPGDSVTITLVFPESVPVGSEYYKISAANGWQKIPFGSNNGDGTITIVLTDGDSLTDADGQEDGKIVDPGALATGPASGSSASGGGGGGGCSMSTPEGGMRSIDIIAVAIFALGLFLWQRKRRRSQL